jgi:hypothetical protein
MKTSNDMPAIQRSWWLSPGGVLLLASILSSVWAWLLIAAPVATFSNLEKHVGHFGPLYLHMIGGTIMLFCGAINLYIGTTRKHFKYHKLVGRAYLIGGSLGAILAIVMALGSAHKSDASIMFTNSSTSLVTLSLTWLAAAGMAYRAVRNRRYDSHRDWIIRSYVLVWSFVFCRLASRVPAVADFGGGEAFIWLSWVGPLIACEIALQWHNGADQRPGIAQPKL